MKRIFTLLTAVLISAQLSGQMDTVSITDINTPQDLANCNDTSIYYLDTVVTYAYVVTDGGLSEVASSSISGGVRPFIWMNDTANGGAVGPRTGLEVMGVNWNTSQATAGFTSLIEGELIEMIGVVGMFDGATQFQPLNNQAVTVLSSSFPTFSPSQVAVGDLNDQNSVNQIQTGQPYEGGYVQFKNVTVVAVNPFGSGASARFSFTIADSAGNQMDVEDFFLAQKLPSWSTVNPNSPATTGNFNPPTVGTFYESISGVIEHSANGCADPNGQVSGSGYVLHPFDSTHYVVGAAAPSITNVTISPAIPSSSDPIVISADIVDPDGSLDSVNIFWSNDTSIAVSAFTKAAMTLTGSNTYSYTIPAQPDETIVRFYIAATDNDTATSLYPATPASATVPNTEFVYVLDGGLTIPYLQRSFDGSGTSPFNGQVVTVKGFVTATDRNCDLGYVYIQDTAATEYAGIALRASLNLAALTRGEEVEITGTVVDGPGSPAFDFARINVININSTGNRHLVEPIELDPSDSATSANMEAYESMLVKYVNPNGKIYVTDGDLGFGEYEIASDPSFSASYETKRILAGRSNPGSADGSLWVSLVSDTAYATQDGTMQVPAIAAADTMTMDAISGIVYYAFGNYKLTPRNNRDFEGLSVSLDTSCMADYFSVSELNTGEVVIYPNPAASYFNVEGFDKNIEVQLYNISGELVKTGQSKAGRVIINSGDLTPGVYILKISDDKNLVYPAKKVIITK